MGMAHEGVPKMGVRIICGFKCHPTFQNGWKESLSPITSQIVNWRQLKKIRGESIGICEAQFSILIL
jgi:hypothetical protein